MRGLRKVGYHGVFLFEFCSVSSILIYGQAMSVLLMGYCIIAKRQHEWGYPIGGDSNRVRGSVTPNSYN